MASEYYTDDDIDALYTILTAGDATAQQRLYTSEPQRNRAGVVFHYGDRVKIMPTGMTGVIEEFCVRPDWISVLILTDVPDAIEIEMLKAGVITSGWRSSDIDGLEHTSEKQGAQ